MQIKNFFSWRNHSLYLLLFIWGLHACTGTHKAAKLGNKISKGKVNIELRENPQDSISFHYTGCSGFLIRYGDQVVLHDPFFSNVGPLLSVGNKTIAPDTVQIQKFFQSYFPDKKDKEGLIKLFLLTHSHYDHMLDAPYIYDNFINKDSTLMYGNDDLIRVMEYAKKELDGTPISNKIISIQDDLTTQTAIGSRYFSLNGKIRILPLATEHASHFYGIHLFQGEIEKAPKKASHWKEGANVAYLIDFLDDTGKIKFRVYSAGAGASSPAGFLPKSILEEHPIDVAILCVASFAYAKNYPEGLLLNLDPKHLILSHWENFFQPYAKLEKKSMVVPFTNVKTFIKKVEKTSKKLYNSPTWTMPDLGTDIIIKF